MEVEELLQLEVEGLVRVVVATGVMKVEGAKVEEGSKKVEAREAAEVEVVDTGVMEVEELVDTEVVVEVQ